MKIYVYPADNYACGSFRLRWPAEALAALGHDITVVPFKQGAERFRVFYDAKGQPVDAFYPMDAQVMVFQRVVEKGLVDLIGLLGRRGVATVVDVDDDLTAIDPGNPAWVSLHPQNRHPGRDISWRWLNAACRAASLVTVTTEGLAAQYGPHGRVRVIGNYLPAHYYDLPRTDSETIGWPAAFFSHTNDPQVTRGAISRLVGDGYRFQLWGDPSGAGPAFGLPADPPGTGPIDLRRWPEAISEIGVGIAPLADTRFNQRKSWLKVAELSAVGVPWVASPRPEYQRVHRLGAGMLAKDKGPDWYRQVRRLLTDPVLRADLSQAGREVAQEHLRLDDNAGLFLDAWGEARALADRGVPPERAIVYPPR
jgi:hypothetical protein